MSMSTNHHSTALYGTSALQAPAAPLAPQHSEQASRLYGVPQAAQQPQGPQPDAQADRLYSDLTDRLDAEGFDKVHASTQRQIVELGVDRLGMDPAEARRSADEWGSTFAKYGLGSEESAHVVEVAAAVLAGSVEPDPSWAPEARKLLSSEFGGNADRVLAEARKLVAADPKLAAFLDDTGLGNHPRIVALAARAAWRKIKGGAA
jgi:hypothetical protein